MTASEWSRKGNFPWAEPSRYWRSTKNYIENFHKLPAEASTVESYFGNVVDLESTIILEKDSPEDIVSDFLWNFTEHNLKSTSTVTE